MPAWISGIQGIREILNSAGTALTRRKQLQFGEGFTAADDGTRTVVTLGAPSASHAAAVAAAIRGPGLTVDANGDLKPRPRPRRLMLQDYFLSGNTTSGGIGALGWSLFGNGTPAVARASSSAINASSRFTLSTSASANNRAVLKLGAAESADIGTVTDFNTLQCVVNFTSTLTDKRFFFGFMGNGDTEAAAAVDALGIYYDSAVSPNFQIIARASSVGSPVVSAVAVPSNSSRILSIYQSSPGVFDFRVANTSLGTISSGLPTAGVDALFRVETLAASIASMQIGYFGAAADIAGNYDDDTFLEV